ncbi:TRAFAC class myosin-kinesin ATPase superfamily [Balamuthia mandrillaris]
MTLAKTLPTFGNTIFSVTLGAGSSNWNLPKQLNLGVSVCGLKILEIEANIDSYVVTCLEEFDYSELESWNCDEHGFSVTVKKQGHPAPQVLALRTSFGIEIVSVMEEYMFWLREDSRHAKALYDYDVTDHKLLAFKKGDVIKIESIDEHGWAVGTIEGRKGKFPVDMVEMMLTPPEGRAQKAAVNKVELKKRRLSVVERPGVVATSARGAGDPRARAGSNISRRFSVSRASVLAPQGLDKAGAPGGRRETVSMPKDMKGGLQSVTSLREMTKLTDITKHSDEWAMQKYAAQYFNSRSQKLKPSDLELKWTKDPLQDSLTVITDAELNKLAVSNFLTIMKYMGDYPTTKETVYGFVTKICQTGIDRVELRDEIYCQLMKQICENPTTEGPVRGWELLAIISGLFLPSRTLLPYLFSFVHSQDGDTSGEESIQRDIARLAQAALMRLGRVKSNGQRKFAPSEPEFLAIQVAEQLRLTVNLMDGKQLEVPIDMAATVAEVIQQIGIMLKVQQPFSQEWRLLAYYGHVLGEDIRYCGGGQLLHASHNLGDVLAMEDQKRGPVTGSRGKRFQFVFLKALWLKSEVEKDEEADDPAIRHLLAAQLLQNTLLGKYPVTQEQAVQLAALKYRLDLPNDDKNARWNEGPFSVNVMDYIAKTQQSTLNKKQWQPLVEKEVDAVISKNPSDADVEQQVMDILGNVSWAKTSVFLVKRKESPSNVALAVHHKGINVIDPSSGEELDGYIFSRVSNWSAPSKNTFSILAGSLLNPVRFAFSTKEANLIKDTYQVYYENANVTEKKRANKKTERRPFLF